MNNMKLKLVIFLAGVFLTCHLVKGQRYIAPCPSKFYCQGDILDKVQMSKAFGESNMFVDMPMKYNSSKTIPALEDKLKNLTSAKDIKAAVEEYVLKAGSEFSIVKPIDWTENPTVLKKIKDPVLQDWAKVMNMEWQKLARKIKSHVETNSHEYSLFYSENAFVLPGRGYRQFSYWNSYWLLNGLLLCDMKDTARGMIENIVDLVKLHGFVPSANRWYYLSRSQPPFLTLMVMEYWKATNDTAFLQNVLPHLEKEYEFWMKYRVVELDSRHGFQRSIKLNQYSSNMGYPRPESYWNDVETARKAGVDQNTTKRQRFYSHIASAAESGWDFSSRWFALTGKHSMKMESIKTRDIVPVDLNAILCKVEKTLSSMFETTGNMNKSKHFKMAFDNRTKAISDAFWDEARGQWLDFDMETKQRRTPFYISNISPIWAECYNSNKTRATKAIESIKKQGVFNYPGGVPTSLNNSGQMWDFPNAWPPLQDMLEVALRNAGYDDLAYKTAKKWIDVNYWSWVQQGHMHEKFNVSVMGKPGYGDHGAMVRYSWTNAVVFKFLDRYGDRVKSIPKDKKTNRSYQISESKLTFTFAILVLLALKSLAIIM